MRTPPYCEIYTLYYRDNKTARCSALVAPVRHFADKLSRISALTSPLKTPQTRDYVKYGASLKITRSHKLANPHRLPAPRAALLCTLGSPPRRGGISWRRRPNYWSSPDGLIPSNGTNRADKTFQPTRGRPNIYWSGVRTGPHPPSCVAPDYSYSAARLTVFRSPERVSLHGVKISPYLMS